jgi:hypothetical protein
LIRRSSVFIFLIQGEVESFVNIVGLEEKIEAKTNKYLTNRPEFSHRILNLNDKINVLIEEKLMK